MIHDREYATALAATTLSARLEQHARLKGDSLFCSFISRGKTEDITFAQLFARSSAYARAYRAMGVTRDDVVIVILHHTPHQFYAYLGAILAGAVPSFMPYPTAKQRADLYWKDHQALFERIEPKLVVTYEENRHNALETLPHFDVPILVASDALLDSADGTEIAPMAAPDDVACLQHSSGTTNLKKGVMLSHRAIVEEVRSYGRAIDLRSSDVIASWLPLYHDMGFIAVFMTAVVEGLSWVALDPFEWVVRPSMLLDVIEKYRATLCWLPNFAFSHIANTARAGKQWDLSSIRAFINCSEPCKAKTFDRFLERFASSEITAEKLQICYAMAENVFAVTQTSTNAPATRIDASPFALSKGLIEPATAAEEPLALVSCGSPVGGVELRIVDEQGNDLPDRNVGEIAIRSPFLFSGYYRLPGKTAERLRDGWYYSRDMGFIADGELYVTGRADDMLIVNGRNYYAHEIEHVVNEIPGILPGRNVAVGVEDPRSEATVVVVLAECAEDADLDAIGTEAKHIVLERLGLAIHSLVPLTKGRLIKTTSGKISRIKNRELYIQGAL